MSQEQEELARSEQDDDDAGFDEGFGADDHPTETPGAAAEEPAAGAQQQPGATDAEPADAAPQEPPRYRQITEAEYEALMERVAAIDEIKAAHRRELDTAFGKVGRIEEQLQRLSGAGVREVTTEDFSELHQEFPEILDLQLKGWNRVLAKAAGQAAPAVDDARIQAAVQPLVQQLGRAVLMVQHPDLPQIESSPEFAQWQASLPEDVQQRLQRELDPAFVGGLVAQFKESRKPPAPAPAADPRRARFAQAVTPRGVGTRPPAQSEDDAFEVGFKTG